MVKETIDWLSVRLAGGTVILQMLTPYSAILTFLTSMAVTTTIVYNCIKIYKEYKGK